VLYRDVECPELGIENTKNKDSKKILEYFHSKMEEESFDGKGEAILNLGKVVDVTNSFKSPTRDTQHLCTTLVFFQVLFCGLKRREDCHHHAWFQI
jgi:hypothetical protein